MKTIEENGGEDPHIRYFGTTWKWVISLLFRPYYSRGAKTQPPIKDEAGWTSDHRDEEKILPGIEAGRPGHSLVTPVGKILGSQGDEYEDDSLVRCCAV